MRRVFCALMLLGLATPAAAGDFDVPPPSADPNLNAPPGAEETFGFLRGAQTVGRATFTRWSGFYFGGDLGFSYMQSNFANATEPLFAYSLRELLLEAIRYGEQPEVRARLDQAKGNGVSDA